MGLFSTVKAGKQKTRRQVGDLIAQANWEPLQVSGHFNANSELSLMFCFFYFRDFPSIDRKAHQSKVMIAKHTNSKVPLRVVQQPKPWCLGIDRRAMGIRRGELMRHLAAVLENNTWQLKNGN